MKKILFLLAFLPMLFLACSSDDDNNKNPMCGTKWYNTQKRDLYDEMYKTTGTIVTLEFITNSEVQCFIKKDDKVLFKEGSFKYDYEDGYVRIYWKNDYADYSLYQVVGNKLEIKSSLGLLYWYGTFTKM